MQETNRSNHEQLNQNLNTLMLNHLARNQSEPTSQNNSLNVTMRWRTCVAYDKIAVC